MKAPAWLHDVLGEEPDGAEVTALLAFASVTATITLALAQLSVPAWRIVVAWLVLADIAAGCVANFTRSTSDFYATRPRNRWMFIAAHVHLPLFAWLVDGSASSAWSVVIVWAFTIIAASAVNLLAGRDKQVLVAGLLLSVGLVLAAAMPRSAVLRVASVLFLTKVAFSFAVDHYRRPVAHDDSVRALDAREHDEAVSIVARAFAADPLFVTVCGDDPRRRAALASFLIDMTRLMGGSVRARSSSGRLVAVSLVDRPADARGGAARYVLVFARFVPTLVSLGFSAVKRLNDYFVATRALVADDSAYLTLLAVDPGAQGRGFGAAMIDDALALARNERAASLMLDTENEQNVTLYQRFGFVSVRDLSLGAMRVFVMTRTIDERSSQR